MRSLISPNAPRAETETRLPDTLSSMAQRRDREEKFDVFHRKYAGDVKAYCLRRADPQLAEDALAETFEIAWRRWEDIPGQPKAWLFGVARRVLANRRRAETRQRALVERMAAQPLEEDTAEEGPPVLEALRRLTPLDQEALRLAAWDELSSREAAQVLGCSPVAFRLRLLRARRRLARQLSELDERSEGPNGVLVRIEETRP
jgi:RNA polymerase sigma factor (sigma-70 family)